MGGTAGTILGMLIPIRRVVNVSVSLFERVVVPVANREDARATAAAVAARIEEGDTVIAVHVIEKTSGAPDTTSPEQRKLVAEEIFDIVTAGLSHTEATVDTEIRYSSDVAATIIETAHERDASAIAFTPRGESRWKKLLSGDVTHHLVAETDIPILVLPDRDESEK